ncbi:hypothetical protein ACFE04_002110 [Oxalis oulophora]
MLIYRLRFRDNCLARVTAGVALGGASGGAVVTCLSSVLYMEILSCNWMYLKYSLEFEYICNAGIRQGAGKQGLLQALPSQVQEKERYNNTINLVTNKDITCQGIALKLVLPTMVQSQLNNLRLKNDFMKCYTPHSTFLLNFTNRPIRLSQLHKVGVLSSNSKLDTSLERKNVTITSARKTRRSTKHSRTGSSVEDGVSLFQRDDFALPVSGIDSTLNSMSKWIVSVLLISMALWRHDGEAMWALTGSVINAILSFTFKRIFNQERPVSSLRSDPGMPSSHAQSIFFILVFLVFSTVQLLGVNGLSLTFTGLVLAFASYLSWLRVSQQFHTKSQVVVGATLGACFATMWYWSWKIVVGQAFCYSSWVRSLIYLGAIGFWLGFFLHSKWIISGLFLFVLLWRHDADSLWAFIGSVINSILGIVLKLIFNHRRPVTSLRSDPGMPSSHAQSIFYICVFLILSIVEWLRINGVSLILSGLVLAFAAYLSWLRIFQGLHSTIQVVVGAAVGTTFSILWYWLWKGIVQQEFDSYLWVRIIVYISASGFCVGFLLYVIKTWFRDEQ